MAQSTLQALPELVVATDSLHNLLRTGAQQLITSAVEAKLAIMLSQYDERQLEDARQTMVHDGVSAVAVPARDFYRRFPKLCRLCSVRCFWARSQHHQSAEGVMAG